MRDWQKAVNDFGDVAALRLDKADILIALHKDNPAKLRAELAGLVEGVDSWKADQKVELWSGMAARYLSLNMTDEARQYWTAIGRAATTRIASAITALPIGPAG